MRLFLSDVNLMINTKVPPNAPPDTDGKNSRFFFDPRCDRWGIDYTESIYATVTHTATDTRKVEIHGDGDTDALIR